MNWICCRLGRVEAEAEKMDTDDPAAMAPEKIYHIDTNNIRVPRANMEMKSFIKDCMSKWIQYHCSGIVFLENLGPLPVRFGRQNIRSHLTVARFPGIAISCKIKAFGYAYLVHYTVLFHNQGGYYNSPILQALELPPGVSRVSDPRL